MTTTSSSRWRLLVVTCVTTAAVGLAVAAYATSAEQPTGTDVCIKPNGQIRVITPENPACVAPEASAEWTTNGVKAITAGAGLIGRDDDGVFNLAVDPGLIENASSGKMVAGFDDGPHEVPDELALIAQLPLPPGNYAIFAKLVFRNPDKTGVATNVTCKLTAGGDFDETSVVVEPSDTESALSGQGTSVLGQSLEVVHRFDEPSRALLFCRDYFLIFPGGDVLYEDLKMIAIGGSSISNTYIGPS